MICRSHLHANISGSVGGITYTRNRYAAIVGRARVTPVDVNSNPLEVQRSIFGQAVAAWKQLTEIQRQGWTDFASGTPWLNKLGDTVYLTGQAMYIGQVSFFSSLFPGASTAPYNSAPCVPGLFPMPLLSFACCPDPDVGVVVTVQNLDATRGMNCVVRISPPQSPGVKYYRGPYSRLHQIVLMGIAAGSTDDASFCDLCEGKYFFQVRCMDAVDENNMSSLVHGGFAACTEPV